MKTLLSHLPPSPIVVVTTRPVFCRRTSSACLGNFCSSLFFCLVFHLMSPPPPQPCLCFHPLEPRSALHRRCLPSLFQGTSCSRWLRSTDRSRCSWRRWLVFRARERGFLSPCRLGSPTLQRQLRRRGGAFNYAAAPRTRGCDPGRPPWGVGGGGGEGVGGNQGNRLLMKSPQTRITGATTWG